MLTLIPFTENHFSILKQWINTTSEEEMIRWAGPTFQFPLTDQQLKVYLSEKNALFFSITFQKIIIGHVALRKIDYVHYSARIGKLFISSSYRGKGYTPQVLQFILQKAFEDLKLRKVHLGVFENNPRALYIYKKFGFKIDNCLVNHLTAAGQPWNLIEMTLLDSDFKSYNKI
ncbi:GNAT family N-acetyltransferase [Alkalicoccus daliensis]|uniref:Protein N-acetyltransferase, RimJ/RimL family n=1 Tax=Alkalicoccus daliensis TaxID=745820 RepID=A0A1H0IAM6_9BACI|nr:GNAT family protein [Alkalicoccus daliensis]SDO28458.1 Protein N-acetyltransferase, RimJ/RimL family [Alkalicoccus daliensis]